MRKIRLLLVDDEEDFRAPIISILSNSGMEVVEAASGEEMEQQLQGFTPDLVLLDINLPDESGLDLVNRLKKERICGIVILSAFSDVEHRIEGLNRGAEYYLSKPVEPRELIAVIQNIYQRQQNRLNQSLWVLNQTEWLLTTPDQLIHTLSQSEFQLLAALFSEPGSAISRKTLYEMLGMEAYDPSSRSLDIQISRLRSRFSTEAYTIPIKTVHSVGYAFTESVLVR